MLHSLLLIALTDNLALQFGLEHQQAVTLTPDSHFELQVSFFVVFSCSSSAYEALLNATAIAKVITFTLGKIINFIFFHF